MQQVQRHYSSFRPTVDHAPGRSAATVAIGEQDRSHIEQLTAQQQRVFALLSEGLSNKEIARLLGLHESTVKVHVSAVLARLGCRNRTTAALLSLRYKLSEGNSGPACATARPDGREGHTSLPLDLGHRA